MKTAEQISHRVVLHMFNPIWLLTRLQETDLACPIQNDWKLNVVKWPLLHRMVHNPINPFIHLLFYFNALEHLKCVVSTDTVMPCQYLLSLRSALAPGIYSEWGSFPCVKECHVHQGSPPSVTEITFTDAGELQCSPLIRLGLTNGAPGTIKTVQAVPRTRRIRLCNKLCYREENPLPKANS